MALGLESAGSFMFQLRRPFRAPLVVLQSADDRGTRVFSSRWLWRAHPIQGFFVRACANARTPGGCPQALFSRLQLLLSEAQPSPPMPIIAESHFSLLLLFSVERQIHGMFIYFRKGRTMPISILFIKQPGKQCVAYLNVWADWLGAVICEALPGSAGLVIVGGHWVSVARA